MNVQKQYCENLFSFSLYERSRSEKKNSNVLKNKLYQNKQILMVNINLLGKFNEDFFINHHHIIKNIYRYV